MSWTILCFDGSVNCTHKKTNYPSGGKLTRKFTNVHHHNYYENPNNHLEKGLAETKAKRIREKNI